MPDPANKPVNDDNGLEMVDRFLDGTLEAEQIPFFQAELTANPETLDALIESAAMDELLSIHFHKQGDESIQRQAFALLCLADRQAVAIPAADPASSRTFRGSGWKRRTWLMAPLAAAVLVAAAAAYFWPERSRHGDTTS